MYLKDSHQNEGCQAPVVRTETKSAFDFISFLLVSPLTHFLFLFYCHFYFLVHLIFTLCCLANIPGLGSVKFDLIFPYLILCILYYLVLGLDVFIQFFIIKILIVILYFWSSVVLCYTSPFGHFKPSHVHLALQIESGLVISPSFVPFKCARSRLDTI